MTRWNGKDGTDPYGRPAEHKGNADELWRLAAQVPCPRCGAREKHVVVEGKRATITCGEKTEETR